MESKYYEAEKPYKNKKSNILLDLSNARQPILVKKQKKYNVIRWAVSGRNDIEIYTKCWQIYKKFIYFNISEISNWKELCYLWSSDFRTHITKKRWDIF